MYYILVKHIHTCLCVHVCEAHKTAKGATSFYHHQNEIKKCTGNGAVKKRHNELKQCRIIYPSINEEKGTYLNN